MPARREIPDGLVDQARRGELNFRNTRRGSQRRAAVDLVRARRGELRRSNTEPGSPERQAVDRVVYEGRKARRAEGETVRAALGHTDAGAERATAVLYGERDGHPVLLYNAELSRTDLRRAARHLSLVGKLDEGRVSGSAFRARVRNWRPVQVLGPLEVAGKYRFLSDPAAVVALSDQVRGEEPEWVSYPNAAMRRRRPR